MKRITQFTTILIFTLASVFLQPLFSQDEHTLAPTDDKTAIRAIISQFFKTCIAERAARRFMGVRLSVDSVDRWQRNPVHTLPKCQRGGSDTHNEIRNGDGLLRQ